MTDVILLLVALGGSWLLAWGCYQLGYSKGRVDELKHWWNERGPESELD